MPFEEERKGTERPFCDIFCLLVPQNWHLSFSDDLFVDLAVTFVLFSESAVKKFFSIKLVYLVLFSVNNLLCKTVSVIMSKPQLD